MLLWDLNYLENNYAMLSAQKAEQLSAEKAHKQFTVCTHWQHIMDSVQVVLLECIY